MKSRRNVLEGIRINFLSPYSPVITLLIGLFLTLLATGNDLPWYIDIFVKNKRVLLVIIIAWLIIAIMHTIYESDLNNKKEKIIKLKESIKEKNNQLNQSGGIILNKYGEFAAFNKLNRFEEVLKGFVDNNIGVECAQMYRYSSKISNEIMKIKLSYQQGYAYEDVDINVILQTYFSMDIKVYKRMSSIISLWGIFNNDNDLSEVELECLEERLFKEIESLLTELIKELRSLDSKQVIKDYHFSYYRIVVLLINLIADEIGNGREVKNILKTDDDERKNIAQQIEEFLIGAKRTGILGGVLLEDTYVFRHTRKNSKSGRVYITFPVSIYKENYVVLIAISSNFLDQIKNWDKLFGNLKEDFIVRMDNTN